MNSSSKPPGPPIGLIENTINKRNQAVRLMSEGLAKIREAQSISPEYALESCLRNDISWYTNNVDRNEKSYTRALDKSFWKYLLNKSSLAVILNTDQLNKLREQIEKEAPVLSCERALPTFMDLFAKREDTFREGVVTVFKHLHGRYKSHDAFKVKNRLILTSYQRQYFNDMWHYLSLLDGVDPTTVPYEERPENIIQSSHNQSQFEFPYFKVVTYQNGNWHLWLSIRPDLIDKVNQLIADYYGQTVPDSR